MKYSDSDIEIFLNDLLNDPKTFEFQHYIIIPLILFETDLLNNTSNITEFILKNDTREDILFSKKSIIFRSENSSKEFKSVKQFVNYLKLRAFE